MLSDEQLAEIRKEHRQVILGHHGDAFCSKDGLAWPCSTDTLLTEVERLRTALEQGPVVSVTNEGALESEARIDAIAARLGDALWEGLRYNGRNRSHG